MNRPAFIALGLRGNHTGSPGDGMAGGGETAPHRPSGPHSVANPDFTHLTHCVEL
ncbi:hypothetical protein MyNCGM683_51270 [Achromobacter xylosoxidans]